jgi:hypothetical protein
MQVIRKPDWKSLALVSCLLVAFLATLVLPADASQYSEAVHKAQQRLTEIGYQVGPIDGQWGEKAKDTVVLENESYRILKLGKSSYSLMVKADQFENMGCNSGFVVGKNSVVLFDTHISEAAMKRGGPRISDRLLRWDPDREGGVWNATKETEFPC